MTPSDKVVQLGKSEPSAISGSEKLVTLKKIETAVFVYRNGSAAPHARQVLQIAFASWICCFLLVMGLKHVGITFEGLPWGIGRDANFYLPAAIAFSATLLAHKFGTKSRTWDDELDHLLFAYEPEDIVAFENLQKQTREIGDLRFVLLDEWINEERLAVTGTGQSANSHSKYRFIGRAFR